MREAGGISRRQWLAGAAMVGVGAVCMRSTRVAAQQKQSQADAKYQDKPQGQDKCDGCSLFQAPEACQVVEGKISPNGWCQLYVKKA